MNGLVEPLMQGRKSCELVGYWKMRLVVGSGLKRDDAD